MTKVRALFARLGRDHRGAMLIETAIVVPVLALLCLGGFEISSIVARQTELQTAASEAAAIALAAKPDTTEKVAAVKSVIEASTGLATNKVTLTTVYRCQNGDDYVAAASDCDAGTVAWRYLRIDMADTYTPMWTEFGVGSPLDYAITRYVMVAS